MRVVIYGVPVPFSQSNPLLQISHESNARRGMGLGQGYSTQIRVTDLRIRNITDGIMELRGA